jgi:hypothetical protein
VEKDEKGKEIETERTKRLHPIVFIDKDKNVKVLLFFSFL